jgi:hypothetical protein
VLSKTVPSSKPVDWTNKNDTAKAKYSIRSTMYALLFWKKGVETRKPSADSRKALPRTQYLAIKRDIGKSSLV